MEKTKRIYIDFHVIQTVPPSCVNRDDTGSPKTAVYGGVQRARVSSQCWKKAMRSSFQENFTEDQLGLRTKKIVKLIADEIREIDDKVGDDKAVELAEKVLKICGVKTKDGEAKALFFISRKQAHNLAQLILGNDEPAKKDAQNMLVKNHSVDIALFGRMVADDPTLNADASVQVAHSISTHRVDNEYDYFTAVDDIAPEDNAGAGMIGIVEYNSSTLYRYATVAVHELYNELDQENKFTVKAIVEFTKAFITSMPTGKQNTFANRTLPDAVLITIRSDQPVNLVGAFEKPIAATTDGYAQKSVNQLNKYAQEIYANFAGEPEKAWEISKDEQIGAKKVNLKELLAEIEKQIADDLGSPEE